MQHELHMSEETAQIAKNTARMLRGYDPLKAIHQGNLILVLFSSELILIGFASLPTFDSAFFYASSAFWGIRSGMIMPFLLLLGIIPLLLTYKHYRDEEQTRTEQRQAALIYAETGQMPEQKQLSPTVQQWPLPMQVTSQQKRAFTWRIMVEIALLVASLIADSAVIFTSPSQPRFLYALPGLLGIMIIALSLVVWLEMRLPIAAHYLHPSLTIDDKAITARYGHDTISIAWHDIHYFALVSSVTFHQLPTTDKPPTFRQILKAGITYSHISTPDNEAFEISDGENIICWLKATPLRHHRLSRFGKIALSDEDYTAFTQQLAALIMARTGLPLYDLRLDRHKK